MKFSCKTVLLRTETQNSPFTSLCDPNKPLEVPIAHGEGCYFADDATLDRLEREDRVAFRYVDEKNEATEAANPNGSARNIAGVLSEGGFITQAEMLRKRIGEGPLIIPVLNKSDLLQGTRVKNPKGIMQLSAKKGQGLDELKELFLKHVRSLQTGESDIVVTNARHVEALTKARLALLSAKKGVEEGISGELLATDLRQAQYHLGEITGKITVEDLLGTIFSRFCIGK